MTGPEGGAPIPAWDGGVLSPRDKIDVHRLGLRHKAVSVFLVAGEKVLIQRRALSKYHTPGLWANSCCTHPYWDEVPAACARRRVMQELGVAIAAPVHAGQVEYRAEVGGGMVEHELVDLFRADVAEGIATAPDPAEVMDLRWIGVPDLRAEIAAAPERFTPWLRIYMADHLHVIFGSR